MLGKCTITDQGLQYISSGFPSLRHLELSSEYITNRGVGYLGNVKCLKSLDLHHCYGLNEECIKSLSENAGSKISCLKIWVTQMAFGYKALEYIGQSQLPLEELELARWNITDNGFRHLVKHGQSIKHLTLYNCYSITDKSLQIIEEKFTALRCLKVLFCDKITKQGLANIKKLKRNLKVDSDYNI